MYKEFYNLFQINKVYTTKNFTVFKQNARTW